MKILTDDETSALANVCRIAAEKFETNISELLKLEGVTEKHGMVRQFDSQAKQAHEWAAYFDNCPPVVMGTCEKCANADGPHECTDKRLLSLIESRS